MSDELFSPDEPEPWPYLPTVMDADLAPDDVAAWAAGVTPGSALLTPLARVDPARLTAAGRIDALVAWDRQLAWVQAQQHKLLAQIAAASAITDADDGRARFDKRWEREQVAAALRLSGRTAADRLALAEQLSRLPDTLALLDRGTLSTHHARAMADAVIGLDDEAAAKVQARVLARAPMQSLTNLRRSLHRAVLAIAPEQVEQQRTQAMAERRVTVRPDTGSSGMGVLWALLPAQGAATVWTACDAVAARVHADDPRTVDQRRADALVQICADVLHGTSSLGALPRQRGLRPAIQVTVALSTLLGLDQQPGELDGHGPIPATLARRIAADETGTWRRLITDDHGRLLDHGSTRYRPPKELAEFVIARDCTCRFPHCNRAARRCEVDHLEPHSTGGPTNEANLHALCPRHHHLKHETDWTVRRLPDGDTEWIDPTEHRYVEPAATYPVDRTAALSDQIGGENLAADIDPDPVAAGGQDPPF